MAYSASAARADCEAEQDGRDLFLIEILHQAHATAPTDLHFDSLAQLNGISFDDRFATAFAASFQAQSAYIDDQAKRLNYRFRRDCVVRTKIVFSPFPFSDKYRTSKGGPVWDWLGMQESYDEHFVAPAPEDARVKADFLHIHFLDRRPIPCSVELLRMDDGSVDLTFRLSVERTIIWHRDVAGWDLLVDNPELAEFGGECAAMVLMDWHAAKSSTPPTQNN